MWQAIQTWVSENWWVVILILLGAYLVRHFGVVLIETIIRRTVTHHSHGDLTSDDVTKRQNTLISMASAVLRVLVWLVAAFTILGLFNLNLTPIFASAGIIGVAIGFGAQSLIKDFLSGMFIILENQYRVGDVVELDGASGKVEQIGIRSTVVRDNDGSVHYIPNGVIQHTINRTMGHARLNLTIAIAPNTDVDKLTTIINDLGIKMAQEEKWKNKILEPPYFLNVSNFSNTTMEIKIAGKMQASAQWSVTGELRKRLLAALNKEGIGLAAGANQTVSKKK